MNLITSTSATASITCAYPGCGAVTTRAESVYVDGCGQICLGCDEAIFGPLPSWWDAIEPPF